MINGDDDLTADWLVMIDKGQTNGGNYLIIGRLVMIII